MRFYGHEKEMEELRRIRDDSAAGSRFTVITGRRRIGKTALAIRSMGDEEYIYIYVSRISEVLLCEEMRDTMQSFGMDVKDGRTGFGSLLEYMMGYSVERPITVIIDEFQDLEYVNRSIFDDIHRIWNLNKEKAHINLIAIGSNHSMMDRIFNDPKGPLYNIPTDRMELLPLPISVMKDIMWDNNRAYTKDDLLTLFMLTGGIPMYIGALMDNSASNTDSMLEYATSKDSLFITEGREMMISEFGKDYRIFLSIMQLIASGTVRRSDMEEILGMELGAYLKRLEEEYGFVRQTSPAFSEKGGRNNRWEMPDMYLRFFFRSIQPKAGMIESGDNMALLRSVFSHLEECRKDVLKEYFKRRISEEDNCTEISAYWERKGDLDVDIIVLNGKERTARFIQVECNIESLNTTVLKERTEHLAQSIKGYRIRYEGLCLEDM